MVKKEVVEIKNGKRLSYSFGKISYIILALVFLALIFYFYFSMQFRIGDFVYSKQDSSNIGVVRAINPLKLTYMIQWGDGSISEEKSRDIAKIVSIDSSKINNTSIKNNKSSPAVYDSREGYNFTDYIIETAKGKEEIVGVFYKGFTMGFLLGNKKCNSLLVCSDWSECKLDYNLGDLIKEDINQGVQYKYCIDENKCLPNIVDSKSCSLRENITVKLNSKCNVFYLYSSDGAVLASLDDKNRKNYMDVDINLLGEGKC